MTKPTGKKAKPTTSSTQIIQSGTAVPTQNVVRNWEYYPAGKGEADAIFKYEIKKGEGGQEGKRIFFEVVGLNKSNDNETTLDIKYRLRSLNKKSHESWDYIGNRADEPCIVEIGGKKDSFKKKFPIKQGGKYSFELTVSVCENNMKPKLAALNKNVQYEFEMSRDYNKNK